MTILLINLQSATERMAFQTTQMSRLGLKFERVDAIAGADVDSDYYARMRTSSRRILSKNEVACFLSHRHCWEECVSTNQPIVELEDDAILDDNFGALVTEILAQLASEPVIVNLEIFDHKKRLSHKTNDLSIKGYSVVDLVYVGAGAAAYIITPQAAKLCLNKAEKTIGLADYFLCSVRGIKFQQLVPAIAKQLACFGLEGNFNTIASTSINIAGTRRPSGLESSMANPMTRVRRLLSWIDTVWKRHIKWTGTKGVTLTVSDGVNKSLLETKRMLNV